MGIVFTYLAVNSVTDTIWNFTTVVLALIATLDFGVGIRFLNAHLKTKKQS
ncbi:YdiK family protein [Ornithinibacillus sp. 4-3]|uniref:YdiK family protein n=1 Tax=Ornithinibacillus sp. 4-3 TaxID=3231488 RepID=A0AB39HPZ1_9BACI